MVPADPGYLSIANVRKTYRDVAALEKVSLEVRRGEFLVLLGPSGCGKSTLLRIVAGLLDATGGTIRLDGAAIDRLPAHRRDIGLVFQSYALFPHMSVADNVRFGLDMRGVGRDEAERRVGEALELVQLADLGRRMPAELSGGQQQRVALARAIVIRPRLLLLDEPLSNLDAVLRTSVRVDIRELHQRTGLTTIMVTHDQAEAMTLADRIAVMSRGRVLQHATPQEVYADPAEMFVAAFVGSPPAALLKVDCRTDGSFSVGGTPWQPAEPVAGLLASLALRQVVLGLRPEALALAAPDAAAALRGRVRSVEYLGADRLVHVEVGGERIVVRRGEPLADSGGEVGVVLRQRPPVFDPEGGRRLDRR